MKKIISLCVFIISSTILFAQTYENYNLSSYSDYYANNYLNTTSAGKGNTGTASESDLSGFLLNPASVNIDNNYQIAAQYTYKTDQKYLNFGNMYWKQQVFSGLIGIGMKIGKNFQAGIVYCNPAGSYFTAEIIRTDEFGNETGRTDYYLDNAFHSFNIPLSYFNKDFRAGINLNYSYRLSRIPGEALTTIQNPIGFEGGDDYKASTSYFSGQAGIIFKPEKNVSLGISIFSGGTSSVKETYPDGTKYENSIARHPWEGRAGIQYTILNTGWKLLFDYLYSRTSDMKYMKDMHNYHFGIENKINKYWIVRGGFFTIFDNRNSSYTDSDQNQFFVTAGISYTEKRFLINLAVLSSMLSSSELKNLYFSGGVTYNF